MAEVNAEIETLNADIAGAIKAGKVKVSDAFRIQRNAFLEEWRWFSGNYLAHGYATTWPSSAWDQVAQYQSKNEVQRAQFRAMGGQPVSPGPQERPKSQDPLGKIQDLALTLGGVGLLAWLLWELK
jgi:hypothetical protein